MATADSDCKGCGSTAYAERLTEAAKQAARAEFQGNPIPWEQRMARLKVCLTCDRYEPFDRLCSLEVCEASSKARFDGEDCPLGKWPNGVSQNQN